MNFKKLPVMLALAAFIISFSLVFISCTKDADKAQAQRHQMRQETDNFTGLSTNCCTDCDYCE
jgi:hypothetical protein